MTETGLFYSLFPSLALPLQEEGLRILLNSMGALDRLRLLEDPFSDDFYLALFLLPFLDFFCPAEEFPGGRQGQADFHLKVREVAGPHAGALSFHPPLPRIGRPASRQPAPLPRVLPLGQACPRVSAGARFFPSPPSIRIRGQGSGGGGSPILLAVGGEKPFRRRRKRRIRKKGRREAGGPPPPPDPRLEYDP